MQKSEAASFQFKQYS